MNSIYLISGILLAVICFFYGMVVLSAGSGTGFYLVWFLIGGGFAGLGVFLHLGIWAAAGLLLFAVVEGMIISQMRQEGKSGLDYILVLGAQINKDGPSRALKYRLDKAAEYMERNPETLCVVSGGQGFNEPCSEAEGGGIRGNHHQRFPYVSSPADCAQPGNETYLRHICRFNEILSAQQYAQRIFC